MADQKISQLSNATTPLAGTEQIPVVQSGATKKVTVANLTAGRAVTASSLEATGDTKGATLTSTGNIYIPYLFSLTTTGFTVNEVLRNYYDGSNDHLTLQPMGGGIEGIVDIKTNNASQFQVTSSVTTVKNGNLTFGTAAKGVNFTANTPAAGMTSQLLNWYEEGTWTPADASGAGLTITKNGTQYYTRVGSLVTAYFDVTYPVTTNASQAVLSLPISTSKNGSGVLSYSDYTTLTVWWLIGSSGMAFYYPGGTLTNVNISGKRFVGSMTYIV